MDVLKIVLGLAAVFLAWLFVFRSSLVLKVNAWIRNTVFNDQMVLFSGRRVAMLLLILGALAIFSGVDNVVDDQSIKPNVAAAMLDEAQAMVKTGKFDAAMRRLKELLRSNPQNVEAWNLMATAAWAAGKRDVAFHAADAVLRLDPKHPIGRSVIVAEKKKLRGSNGAK